MKIATTFLNDEKDRLMRELGVANRTIAQNEDVLMKKDEQIRDLSKDQLSMVHWKDFRVFQNVTSVRCKVN